MPSSDSTTYDDHRPTESPPDSPPRLLVSVPDMAHMLGISRREAYRLLDDQRVESRWQGRRRLIPVASIEAFAASLPSQRTA